MTTENTQLSTELRSVKDYLALPAYRSRFEEVLKNRAPQFMAAIVQSSQLPGLKDAEPRSVIAAAMTAATLDLPINPTLGQAHLVAYGDGQGNKVAQFQIGYKGLIQLALRSGQYKRLNAGPVRGHVFQGYDNMGEPVLDWSKADPVADVVGYFCAFETLNGFSKTVYMTKAEAEAHGKRFSKAYQKGWNTPWKTDFDSMAVKTCVKAALSKWGPLSVEMQRAVVHDQGTQADVDAEVKYVDGTDEDVPERPLAQKGAATVEKPVRAKRPAPAAEVVVTPEEQVATPAPAATVTPALGANQTTEKQPAPAPAAGGLTPDAIPGDPITELAEGQRVSVTCRVKAIATGMIDNLPSVRASVTGGFVGDVRHIGGASAVAGADPMPNAPWKAGAEVVLSLVGKKYAGNAAALAGKVLAYVEKAEAKPEEF
jgi:recombination protein RecT